MAIVDEPKVFDLSGDDDVAPDKPFVLVYKERIDPTPEELEKMTPAQRTKRQANPVWEDREEKFTARGEVPAGVIMQTVAAFNRGGAAATDNIIQFLDVALYPDDSIRFRTLVTDTRYRIRMAGLAKVTDWLLEEYGERPT